MASQKQIELLQQGVKIWNEWRKESSDLKPDLQQADLRDANLYSANLREVNLERASLQRANLVRTNLRGANLTTANFTGANLQQADLRGANLTTANFTGANLQQADLRGVNLREADLREISLYDANLQEADLRGANLSGADLSAADLQGVNLSGADLRGAHLNMANLSGTDLTRANLAESYLNDAHIGSTALGDLDLRNVHGLDTVRHLAPSTIGIDTIYRSRGNIPKEFLKNAGVPAILIDYMHSLTVYPVEYFSCFISYSSKDQQCAERLYTDLQRNNVRCWFAPHDMEIGKPIVRGIDEAIRLYDKLLIILSESSVKSGWVEYEVTLALTRENTERRTMLFPIRLDDSVLEAMSGWAVDLRSRHVGDFRGWKQHEDYQKAFQRLLRDLRASEPNTNI